MKSILKTVSKIAGKKKNPTRHQSQILKPYGNFLTLFSSHFFVSLFEKT
jgi:hypothetical protein